MLLFSFGVIIIILLILSSRNLSYLSARFLYGMILGWAISLVALLVYLSNYDYYFPAVRHIFNITASMWNVLVKSGLRIDVTIRLLNGGNLLFLYSLGCFSLAFVSSTKKRSSLPAIVALAVIPVSQMVLYDPSFIRMIFSTHFGAINEKVSVLSIMRCYGVLDTLFRVANLLYLAASFLLLLDFALRRAVPSTSASTRQASSWRCSLSASSTCSCSLGIPVCSCRPPC